MGIQGYVSHLIKGSILIESITILCVKNKEHQRIDFGSALPKIKVMEYDPKDFHYDFSGSSKVKVKDAEIVSSKTYENFDQNETAKSACTSEEGTLHSAVTVTSPDRSVGTVICGI